MCPTKPVRPGAAVSRDKYPVPRSGGLGVGLEDLVRGLDGKGDAANDDEVTRVVQAMRGMTRAEARQTVDVVEALERKGAGDR